MLNLHFHFLYFHLLHRSNIITISESSLSNRQGVKGNIKRRCSPTIRSKWITQTDSNEPNPTTNDLSRIQPNQIDCKPHGSTSAQSTLLIRTDTIRINPYSPDSTRSKENKNNLINPTNQTRITENDSNRHVINLELPGSSAISISISCLYSGIATSLGRPQSSSMSLVLQRPRQNSVNHFSIIEIDSAHIVYHADLINVFF